MMRTRFAPSPTGYLHLGHAYSALFAFDAASPGEFILRIEDIDGTRCKPIFATAILEDLEWLGLTWKQPVRLQSHHINDYAEALKRLEHEGLIYPCFCTRKDIAYDAERALSAPHANDGHTPYSGTCKRLSKAERANKLAELPHPNWRLDCKKACAKTGTLFWHDAIQGEIEAAPLLFGDVVLARKDIATSYHLSVTVDDHLQDIDVVTRGSDLFTSTHIHRLLQALLGYRTPRYHHHPLLVDDQGRRFAKRDQAKTLRALRTEGFNRSSIRVLIEQLRNSRSDT